MARPPETAADLGHDYCAGISGPSLFFHCGLVPDLSGGQRNLAKERLDRGVDSIRGHRSRQFFWWLDVGLLDQARLASGKSPQSAGSVWRNRRDAADPDGVHHESVYDHVALRGSDVLLRVVYH